MIPEVESRKSVQLNSEKDIETVIDWFNHNQQNLIQLGWLYARNEHQLEELLFQAIVSVYKELPRIKQQVSTDKRRREIFLHTCRQLMTSSGQSSELRPSIYKSLDLLTDLERETVVLVYFVKISKEETAQLLKVSEGKVDELLRSGLCSLRQPFGYGESFNGCEKYQSNYLHYLENQVERAQKIELEVHLHHCPHCQEDLSSFQDTRIRLLDESEQLNHNIPFDLMENIRIRIKEWLERRQQKKKRFNRIFFSVTSFIALIIAIGTYTGYFAHTYYAWTEEDDELLPFLQEGLGERLDLVVENAGVKIRIKSVVADEYQTLVFYEIEDKKNDHQYLLNLGNGVAVENESKIMDHDSNLAFNVPNLETKLNKKSKNVYHGKLSLLPLSKKEAIIQLSISKLMKLDPKYSEYYGFNPFGEAEFHTGKWNFEIPVVKQPTTKYALDYQTEIEGIPVRFNQLIMAPTATILHYSISNKTEPEKRLENLMFDHVKVNQQKLKIDLYGGGYFYGSGEQTGSWTPYQAKYEPLFDVNPKELSIQLGSAYIYYEDNETIELGLAQQYPQTFNYAGSTISIDKLEIGNPTKLTLSNEKLENRKYDSLNLNLINDQNKRLDVIEMEMEEITVDKHGKKHLQLTPLEYEKLELPRNMVTSQTIQLVGENVIPRRLEILGYSSTKYLNDEVKITLD